MVKRNLSRVASVHITRTERRYNARLLHARLTVNRRAQAEMMDWIPRLLLLATAITVIAFLVRYYSDRDANASEISSATYLYRIYYDGNIIMYTDPVTKRVYPGIIDLQKFKETDLDDMFDPSSSSTPGIGSVGSISSQLTLSDDKGVQIAPPLYNNKDEFTLLQPSAAVTARSGGAPIIETVVWPVTIRDGNKMSPGTLKVLIIRVGK